MLGSSGGKGKEKYFDLSPIHEDEDFDEMSRFDSGNFLTIDTLDVLEISSNRTVQNWR